MKQRRVEWGVKGDGDGWSGLENVVYSCYIYLNFGFHTIDLGNINCNNICIKYKVFYNMWCNF